MPVDARLKAPRGTCAPLVCVLLILAGTAQETTGRALRATVPAGAVQKGPSLGLAAPKGPVTKDAMGTRRGNRTDRLTVNRSVASIGADM
jgi:hypothetical protein